MRFNPLLIVLSATLFVSCSKDGLQATPDQKPTLNNGLSLTPETPNPNGGTGNFVVLNGNGEYVTSYGGGISFGSTFTYPLSVQSYQNGTPYSPFYYGGYSTANMLSFTQDGPHFTMLLGTVVGGINIDMYNAIHSYDSAFHQFIGGNGGIPQFSDFATRYGGSADGILTVNGTFVLDTQSPTHVSVTNLKYVLPAVE